jgi:cellulose synthase/poly-beta-1,6-N-acetylglucosamine synthase-like glycosyltransferase
MIFYLLTFLVCGGYAALMILYFIGWRRTPSGSALLPPMSSQPRTRVSIILPVRNEGKNIPRILEHLSKQDYEKENYEIVVVDDFSEDNTAGLIEAAGVSNLKLVRLKEKGGKKQAITEGIYHSKGVLIVTTDADCQMGEQWLSSLVSFYEEHGSRMIIAPVLLRGETSFPQIVQSQEMTVLTASACASLYYDIPLLCSGANLAYEKEAFLAVNGFEGVDQTATGDDVFLMLKIQKQFQDGINYLKSKEAVVFTHPEPDFFSAMRQRKRWASKTFSYGFSLVTGIAMLIFLMNFFILLSGILSVINVKFAYALITSLSLKCIVDFMLLRSASSFFGKKVYPVYYVLGTLIYPLYVTFIGLISPFTQYIWKGRQF